ncbi:MAG: penicillin-binding protein 2 [Methylophilaceae bacterium]|jgi:cell division protein FtsI (penicillin-binding protein 3)|nr:penicillin-binding protein 2 [Methylophilaceae bacterium]MDG1453109.1 penicillin-binding protein 2 [Methylophilaceae bacterium]
MEFKGQQKQRQRAVGLPAWRRRVLLVAVLSGFMLLVVQSVSLQSTNKAFLQKKGGDRYIRTLELQADRGKIKDRRGEILAGSSPVASVWVNPSVVEITEKQKLALAKLLDMKVASLDQKVSNKQKEFIYIKRRIAPDLAEQVDALDIAGVYLEREYKRFYPAGDVTSHVVGFTGVDGNGQEGLELVRNDALAGQAGQRRVIKDRAGQIVEELEVVREPSDGDELTLSIDRQIQYLVFRELSKAIEQYKAKAGSAVVLDAKTGEVLAMVNFPTYNPNNPINIKGKTRNRALTDVFEPGSTMKPVTAAAALEFGGYLTTTTVDTAPGYMKIGPATIHDTHSYAELTVAEVVKKSSNVGSAKIALSLDKKKLWNVFNQLGFGEKTDIGFPGEVRGKVRDYKTWRPIEQATMSYGHGISVTLLQLARAYTVFANDGELKPVSLVKLDKAPIGQPVFSASVAKSVKDMLELVVQEGGTGTKAQVAGYRIAGKTGTAHKLGANGYERDKYVGSFVGLAPASNPRLIMAVMIDEPTSGQYYGGTVAAPVFSSVMSEVLRLLAVPQDAPNTNIVKPVIDDADVQEMV